MVVRIMGVDPALRKIGVAFLDLADDGRIIHVKHELLTTNKGDRSHASELRYIGGLYHEQIKAMQPDFVCYERPWLGRTRSGAEVQRAVGAFLIAAAQSEHDPIEVQPSEWKAFFLQEAGSKIDSDLTKRKDKKAQTREAIKVLFPDILNLSKESDCWDAIGVAYWLAKNGVIQSAPSQSLDKLALV